MTHHSKAVLSLGNMSLDVQEHHEKWREAREG